MEIIIDLYITNTTMNRPQLWIIIILMALGHGIAGACDFCNCLMGINPNYNSADKIMFHVLLQQSYYTPSGDASLPFGSKLAAGGYGVSPLGMPVGFYRSEEHTAEIQSLAYLACHF